MIQLDILMMATYFTHFAASSKPQLSVLQYPPDASVLLNSTVWMLCVFEYPSQEEEEPVVYWRKGPECHKQPSLQMSPSTGRAQVQITKNTLRGFSILQLSNVDQSASSSYFCNVMLTQKIQGTCGNGTRLTVHDLKCRDCSTSDKIWWGWFLLLGYTIFVTTVIIAFGIHHCHTKSKNKLRNTDSSATMQSEWIYDQPSRPVNNGFSQEYEDMSVIRALCDTGREMI
ncbi:uncharacterized protein LOC130255330 [Oenanthe melanoleuca]|uniref:uncharacterized protein LOC130255330 n=1 Tax=Oenanthe melanoleuca TaxID=2939378 RepID=UPI0024C1018F|nr:uncharacterized protein LOC130255330 [Oenanthe melanoleuca]